MSEREPCPPPFCYDRPVASEISNEELAAALAANFDEDGEDRSLAEWTAQMTPEERRQADESVRRFAEAAQRSVRDHYRKQREARREEV